MTPDSGRFNSHSNTTQWASPSVLAPVGACLHCGRPARADAKAAADHPDAMAAGCRDENCGLPVVTTRRHPRAHLAHYKCVDAGGKWPECTRRA